MDVSEYVVFQVNYYSSWYSRSYIGLSSQYYALEDVIISDSGTYGCARKTMKVVDYLNLTYAQLQFYMVFIVQIDIDSASTITLHVTGLKWYWRDSKKIILNSS